MRRNNLKKQRINAELETIIENFARTMRNADRGYVSQPPSCEHDSAPRFTSNMYLVWNHYVEFCKHNPQ